MPNIAIQLSVDSKPNAAFVEMLELGDTATAEFFDHSSPSFGGNRIQLSSMDGINHNEFNSFGFGVDNLFMCTSNNCVSDSGVFESITSLISVDLGLLANFPTSSPLDNMHSESSFHGLNAELFNSMPRLQMALDGELGYTELSQLIHDIQTQVLELNAISQEFYGDVSAEVSTLTAEISEQDFSSLLSSMQIDSVAFTEPTLVRLGSSLAHEATLDGLFTAPESFPLTLDFSNPDGIQEALVLFAAASGGSSISSTAQNTGADDSLTGFIAGAPDFS